MFIFYSNSQACATVREVQAGFVDDEKYLGAASLIF